MSLLTPSRELWRPTRRCLIKGAGAAFIASKLPFRDADAQQLLLGVDRGAAAAGGLNLVFNTGSLPSGVAVARESHGLYFNSSNVLALANANTARFDYGQNGGAAGGGSSICRGLMVEPYSTAINASPAVLNTVNQFSSFWTHSGLTLGTVTGPDGAGSPLNNGTGSACSMVATATGTGPFKQYAGSVYFNYPITAGWNFTVSAICRVHSGSSGVYPMLGSSFGTATPTSGSTPQVWGLFDIGAGGSPGACYAPSANYNIVSNGAGAQQLTPGSASSAWWLCWLNFTIPASSTQTGWYFFIQPWGATTFADNFSASTITINQGIDFYNFFLEMQPNAPDVTVPPNNVNTSAGISMASSYPVQLYPSASVTQDLIMPGALSSTAYIKQPSSGNNGSGFSTTINNIIDVPGWGDAAYLGAPASGTIGTSGFVMQGGTPQASVASSGLATTAINAGANEQSAYGTGATMGGSNTTLGRTADFVSLSGASAIPAGTTGLKFTFDDGSTKTLPVLPVYANLNAAGLNLTSPGPVSQMRGSGVNYVVPTNLCSGRRLASVASASSSAPLFFIESDISTDEDDVAALYNALYNATAGNINLIGFNANASDPYAGSAAAAILYSVGFGHVPVGQYWQAGCCFTGTIASGVLTVSTVQTGALAVNQALNVNGSIVAGVTISSLGTGTGGVGTYNLAGASGITISSATAMSSMPGLVTTWGSTAALGMDMNGNASMPTDPGKNISQWYGKVVSKSHGGIVAGYTSGYSGTQGLTNPLVPGWQNLLDCCFAAPDFSVNVINIGFWGNIYNALNQPNTLNYRGSGYSPAQILAKKIKAFYVLGGGFNMGAGAIAAVGVYANACMAIIQGNGTTVSNGFNGNTVPTFSANGCKFYLSAMNYGTGVGTFYFQQTNYEPTYNLQNLIYLDAVMGSHQAWDPSAMMMGNPLYASLITLQANLAASFNGQISGTTLTVNSMVSGQLQIGQTISGAGIGGGITITGNTFTGGGTGAGWTGTYTLSSSPGTISAEAMTATGVAGYINNGVFTLTNPGSYSATAYSSGENYGPLTGTGVMANGSTMLTVSGWSGGAIGTTNGANTGTALTIASTSIGAVVSQIAPLLTGETYGGNGRYTMSAAAGSALSGALTGTSTQAQVDNALTAVLNTSLKGLW